MLHYKTIEPGTLELLNKLQAIPALHQVRLVGGTSLALQIGHRKSVDLDLFGTLTVEPEEMLDMIRPLGDFTIIQNTGNIHVFMIEGIKVDIINYPYPWLSPALETDHLRLASIEDIVAMKIAAIVGRGTRKDFIDIHFLLRRFSLQKMLDLYTQKYVNATSFMALKSLAYFDDAEEEPEPYMFESVEWSTLKAELGKHVADLS